MKVIFINTNGKDGGAGRAAFRLLQGMRKIGVKGLLLAESNGKKDPLIIGSQNFVSKKFAKLRRKLDSIPTKIYFKRRNVIFSTNFLPDRMNHRLKKLNPDLIHFHWISGNFLRIEGIKKIHKPIIWTLHDMWPFTGGCHYDFYCGKYKTQCGACPILRSKKENDLSKWNLERKANSWKDINLTIVAPSNWLAQCVRGSYVFRNKNVHVIPNGLNLEIFRPYNKIKARISLNLPKDKKLILFGAWTGFREERKGINLIKTAIKEYKMLSGTNDEEIIIFGVSEPSKTLKLGLKVNFLDHIKNDETLAKIYSAGDVFIAPSLQDNLPNTVMEAIACGTPCVAFNIGGMPDMITHKKSGYLARPFDPRDLATGIEWVLNEENRWKQLSQLCRIKAENNFEIGKISYRYKELYEKVIAIH